MRLLDLFCGAGGAAKGYQRAGFYVVGVDNRPQPRYCGDEFYQADALEFVAEHGKEFDVIHASPPCQAYSRISGRCRKAGRRIYPEVIEATRQALRCVGVIYVIENVPEAPLERSLVLCGSSFGLDVRRHRVFESNVLMLAPVCEHSRQSPRFRTLDNRRKGRLACVVGVHGHVNYKGEARLREGAMGVDWMTVAELAQAIPPAYTEFIGKQLMAMLDTTEQPAGLVVGEDTDRIREEGGDSRLPEAQRQLSRDDPGVPGGTAMSTVILGLDPGASTGFAKCTFQGETVTILDYGIVPMPGDDVASLARGISWWIQHNHLPGLTMVFSEIPYLPKRRTHLPSVEVQGVIRAAGGIGYNPMTIHSQLGTRRKADTKAFVKRVLGFSPTGIDHIADAFAVCFCHALKIGVWQPHLKAAPVKTHQPGFKAGRARGEREPVKTHQEDMTQEELREALFSGEARVAGGGR
jgi:DNA (cytosine-5)-methyltransferase 1